MSNAAFKDAGLRGQAKFGAVLSIGAAFLAWFIRYAAPKRFRGSEGDAQDMRADLENGVAVVPAPAIEASPDEVEGDWVDDVLVDEILQAMWLQRRYEARGINMHFSELSPKLSPRHMPLSPRRNRDLMMRR
eukprot:TRINITY_DN11157_c0_g1_i1.p2 TRINITY_DN11157_c0_g1~~TRINITY_DN11157_c0_g1_i1.p2  ORF type:complete len:132 (+),score=28.05 TRINITY_DN11157_c0_g1_i1:346-741(+)